MNTNTVYAGEDGEDRGEDGEDCGEDCGEDGEDCGEDCGEDRGVYTLGVRNSICGEDE